MSRCAEVALRRCLHACPYGNYVRWLSARRVDSEAFWRAELDGVMEPTPLDLGFADSRRRPGPGEEVLVLSPAESRRAAAGRTPAAVTLNSVVQAAWAPCSPLQRTLRRRLRRCVLRSTPELPGSTNSSGHASTTCRCASHLDGESQSLRGGELQLQQRSGRPERCTSTTPSTDPGVGRVPLRLRLFDSLIVFQNYIVDRRPDSARRRARLRLSVGPDATNYPVTLVVSSRARTCGSRSCGGRSSSREPGRDDAARSSDGARGDGRPSLPPVLRGPCAASRRDARQGGHDRGGAPPRRDGGLCRAGRARWRRQLRRYGGSCSKWIGSGWTTTSSTSEVTRCSLFVLTNDFSDRSASICRFRRSSSTRRRVRWRGICSGASRTALRADEPFEASSAETEGSTRSE